MLTSCNGWSREERRAWAAALMAGFLLRAVFVWFHPRFVGDTLVYGDLAQNLLHGHGYGLTEDGHVRATLIRLPGYPLFLAACFAVFGVGRYLPVIWLQVFVDLLGCVLLGLLARQVLGVRVGRLCVCLAALCPFTANYAAAALTETLSIFCVTIGFWALGGWFWSLEQGRRGLRWATGVGIALYGAALLRPDGVLLAAAVLPTMAWVAWRGPGGTHTSRAAQEPGRQADVRNQSVSWNARRLSAFSGMLLVVGLLLAGFGCWTLRNWRVLHVFQPLAPKYANDPGEPAPTGFARWYRTWALGLGDTARVYWAYDGSVLSLSDLPPWAFDSPAQRAETAQVYARYNAETSATPESEAAFARLGAERGREHPVRTYVVLPVARLADMWLRPRTELLPRMPLDWWNLRVRPKASLFAYAYGALNLTLLLAALAGLVRWWRSGWNGWGTLAAVMVAFVALRSAMLLTIDNSEPRYVLECYPVVLFLAARGLTRWERQRA